MKIYIQSIFVCLGFFIFTSCEKEITVDLPEAEDVIVVEGYIENDVPPYVLLTRNSSYFGSIDVNDLNGLFVHGAEMYVYNNGDSVELQEVCMSTLSPAEQEIAGDFLGVDIMALLDSGNDFCLYTSADFANPSASFVGAFDNRYDLKINVEGQTLTSTTYIPNHYEIDSLYIEPHPNADIDSLVRVRGIIDEPDTLGNYIRLFVDRNGEGFNADGQSVFDDGFINGEVFPIRIIRPLGQDEDFDPESTGYFWRGDTVTVKWSSIDQEHFNFWSTIESQLSGQGSPFSSYTIIDDNIEGGVGIWGGYGSSYHQIIIPQ